MDIIRGEQRVEDMTIRNVLEKTVVTPIKGATPSVLNGRVFICNNTSPVEVTDFLKGSNGQTIKILGDGNTTVKHGTFIFTLSGLDLLLETNKVYTFTCFETTNPKSHKWVEG